MTVLRTTKQELRDELVALRAKDLELEHALTTIAYSPPATSEEAAQMAAAGLKAAADAQWAVVESLNDP